MQKSKAAVLFKKKLIKIIDLEIQDPKINQVLVKNIYASICGTQLGEWLGKRNNEKIMPNCFGHESISKVVKIGSNIKGLKKGDIVCGSWIKKNSLDSGGTKYHSKVNGSLKEINAGPINTFSEYSLISQNRLYKISKKFYPHYTLMGCAFMTAFNIFYENKINKKHKICIVGMGGIGFTALIIAKNLGLKKISCVDKNNKKFDLIKKIFKSKDINLTSPDKMKDENFDFVIDCVGIQDIFEKFFNKLNKFGGKYVVVGNPKFKTTYTLKSWDIIIGKSICGCWNKKEFFNKKFYLFFNKFKKFKNLNKIFDKKYKLNQLNSAFKDLYDGKVLRPLIKI